MTDPSDDDEVSTSAFLTVFRHDHARPDDDSIVVEGPVARLGVQGTPAGAVPDMGAVVTIRAALVGEEFHMLLMLDAVQARELAQHIVEAADRAEGV